MADKLGENQVRQKQMNWSTLCLQRQWSSDVLTIFHLREQRGYNLSVSIITEHLSSYAQVITTMNQTASTITKVLY